MTHEERNLCERVYLYECTMSRPDLLDAGFPELFRTPQCRALYIACKKSYDISRPQFDLVTACITSGLNTAAMLDMMGSTDIRLFTEQVLHALYDAWLRDEIDLAYSKRRDAHGLDALMEMSADFDRMRKRFNLDAPHDINFEEHLSTEAQLYKTGIEPIDRFYGGFAAGEIIAIAGRPGAGKTTLGCTIATNFALSGTRCVFHSYEMRPNSVWSFIASRMTLDGAFPVSISDIRRRHFDESQKQRMIDAYKHLVSCGLTISNDAGVEIRRLCASIETSPEPMHFVDHLGCVPTDGMSKEYDLVTSASNRLREAAKRSGKTVVELVQLSRGNEGTPGLSDLRGSGHIEQDVDGAIFIHEPEKDQNKINGYTIINAQLVIDKWREGATGHIDVRINRPHAYVFTQSNSEQLPAF